MDATAACISNYINWEKTDPLILRCDMNTHTHCERVRRGFQMASKDHHFCRQQANWCLLTHPNTHSLILRDTSPAGGSEDAAILNHTILPKLDMSQRWQSGRGVYTWVNKQKTQQWRDTDRGNYVHSRAPQEKTRVLRELKVTIASTEEPSLK